MRQKLGFCSSSTDQLRRMRHCEANCHSRLMCELTTAFFYQASTGRTRSLCNGRIRYSAACFKSLKHCFSSRATAAIFTRHPSISHRLLRKQASMTMDEGGRGQQGSGNRAQSSSHEANTQPQTSDGGAAEELQYYRRFLGRFLDLVRGGNQATVDRVLALIRAGSSHEEIIAAMSEALEVNGHPNGNGHTTTG